MIPASRVKRVFAFFLDNLILTLLVIISSFILTFFVGAIIAFSGQGFVDPKLIALITQGFVSILFVFGGLLYFALFESSKSQATLGRKLLGLYVSDANGEKLTFKRALCRWILWHSPIILMIVLIIGNPMILNHKSELFRLGLAFWSLYFCFLIPIFFTKERTTLYDMLSSTRVNKKENKSVA